MSIAEPPDRQRQLVWLVLSIVGLALGIIGWYRWAT